MNRSLALLLLIGIVAAVAATETTQLTQTVVESADSQGEGATSTFDALSLFYTNGKVQTNCYRCTSPCSAYQCCAGPYPQCCYISGLGCRCCAR